MHASGRLLIIFLMLTTSLYAQRNRGSIPFFEWGARAGAHNTETKVRPRSNPDIRGGETKMGYHVGTYMRFNFRVFYIEPEFQFAHSIGAVEFQMPNEPITQPTFGFNRLDLPIQVGQKLGPLRLYMGVNFNFNRTESLSSMVLDGLQDESRAWRVGLGLDAGSFSMDVRYETSMTNNFEGLNYRNEFHDVNLRFTHLLLSFGYKIM
jgi:hypothetical protein